MEQWLDRLETDLSSLKAILRQISGLPDPRADAITAKLDALLDHVKSNDVARQQFLDLLEELGAGNPQTAAYRRQLSARLY
jgi:thioredoxin-like negative regulator of GroEL